MNKQELIDKYEDKLKDVQLKFGANFKTKVYEGLVEDLQQLDEPKKPAVPQFVADWYEENKDDFEGNLFRCAHNIPSTFDGAKLNEFERWFLNASIKAFQILVNMHQFGYTVEKEKRYTVRLKYTDDYLVKTNNGDYRFYNNIYTNRRKHTRKEIEKARFGWVFDCEGIEVKEVE
jgi:gp178|nr:MAG TPA: Protein of unknown function (DUF1642) [Caudoviricetes sp.]